MNGKIIIGTIFVVMGLLSFIYNRRSGREYEATWGRRLKHGYAVGRFISVFGGTILLLIGLLMVVGR